MGTQPAGGSTFIRDFAIPLRMSEKTNKGDEQHSLGSGMWSLRSGDGTIVRIHFEIPWSLAQVRPTNFT